MNLSFDIMNFELFLVIADKKQLYQQKHNQKIFVIVTKEFLN